MTRLVLDASIALSWFVDHPVAVDAERVRGFLSKGVIALIPAIWELEMINGFVKAERRQTLSKDEVDRAFFELTELRRASIQLDSGFVSLQDTLAIARTHQLTSYDASYIELARRLDLALTTLDAGLKAAAGKAGVKLL